MTEAAQTIDGKEIESAIEALDTMLKTIQYEADRAVSAAGQRASDFYIADMKGDARGISESRHKATALLRERLLNAQ